MSIIPYHRAKKLIETGIKDYVGQFNGIELPKIEIKKEGENTSVNFSIDKNTNLYKIINIFVKTIGEMKIQESLRDLRLSYKNESICFSNNPFENSVHFYKREDFTSQEIEAILEAYKSGNLIKEKTSPKQRLLELGVTIYNSNNKLGWEDIAGYENVKQEIKENILLPLQNPEIYEQIAKGTRKKYESIKPKAVLFEGPSGTGKTTSARIIAGESESPMVYIPIESIMTKWYGESENNLAEIFDASSDLGSSLIFLDEIDSLATSREKDIYEATRRVLSVLLRKIDGFEPNDKTILIGATNRKQDLDPALLNRFDLSVHFHLPNLKERASIFGNYAKHLSEGDLEKLAQQSEGISGRNIKDICKYSERKWASKLLREAKSMGLPPLKEYFFSLKNKKGN